MSTPSSTPEAEHQPVTTPRWVPILFVVLFLLGGYLLYAGISSGRQFQAQLGQSNQKIGDLSTQLDKANSTITDLRGELDLTAQKLGITEQQLDQARKTAQAARREQLLASRKLQQQLGQMQQQHAADLSKLSSDLGGQIQATQTDLADTKTKLDRTVGDMGVMSGLVAHNKGELEQLKRLGERNIYEFDLHKSKSPSRIGPIMVALRKSDTKHWRYTMDVVVEDKRIQKKDKTLYEPVQFYVERAPFPYEIVVYKMNKNEVVGYLSTPKAGATPATAAANVSPSNGR
jgi:multidrug efflux pump subunit AcrA (membrane-fusion protein)